MIHNPFELLRLWLDEEKSCGAPNPQHAILSTVGTNHEVHGRVVAVRDFSEEGFLFFTQRRTRKVSEMIQNPRVSLTFWFELYQREVIVEGEVKPLSEDLNVHYWSLYPKEAQIRFSAYAPTSGQPIQSKQLLEEKRQHIRMNHEGHSIPVSPEYCGFLLQPTRFLFYAYQPVELSDVFEFLMRENQWYQNTVSP